MKKLLGIQEQLANRLTKTQARIIQGALLLSAIPMGLYPSNLKEAILQTGIAVTVFVLERD